MNTTLQTRPAHRRLLAPLATLLIAIALVGTSGATFTSSSASAVNTYTAGTLTHSNTKAGAVIFNAPNMKPGDIVIGTATIENDGSLPARFTLHEDSPTNTFSNQALLELVVTDQATGLQVYNGAMGQLGAQPIAVDWAAGEARTFEFKVTLALATGDIDQGKTANAIYRWEAVQTDQVTLTQ